MASLSISDVCKMLDVKPHVLRYWEQEIPLLSPRKDNFGRRVYSKRDLNLLFRIRHLLYDNRYTIDGARRKILAEIAGTEPNTMALLHAVRSELLEVSRRLEIGRAMLDSMVDKGK